MTFCTSLSVLPPKCQYPHYQVILSLTHTHALSLPLCLPLSYTHTTTSCGGRKCLLRGLLLSSLVLPPGAGKQDEATLVLDPCEAQQSGRVEALPRPVWPCGTYPRRLCHCHFCRCFDFCQWLRSVDSQYVAAGTGIAQRVNVGVGRPGCVPP